MESLRGEEPGSDRSAAVVETHISVLWMFGDRVWKILKPVSLGFLDFSTRDRRREACRREVDLNRRFAPDVYLGVLDITRAGSPVEHAVEMVRMPDQRRLSALVASAEARDLVRAVGRAVAVVHAGAERSVEIDRSAGLDRVRANWEDNLAVLATGTPGVLAADTVAEVGRLARRYMDGRAPLFAERISSGCAVDGHGDLLADDIFCLPDGPRILDCLAFSDALRYGDVLADIGFLAMDLERLGHPELADSLMSAYGEFSGERYPSSLADFWIAYRAGVRAKVAVIRERQRASGGSPTSGPGAGAAAGARGPAADLVDLCLRRLRRAEVRLVLVGGSPAVGKSTVAERVGDALGWTVVSTDVLRKEAAGVDPATPLSEAAYSDTARASVYEGVLERARSLLERGESVILDASWGRAADRSRARLLGEQVFARLVEVRCTAPVGVCVERARRRQGGEGAGASDAGPEVARRLAESFEGWPEAAEVDTSGSRSPDPVDAVLALIDGESR